MLGILKYGSKYNPVKIANKTVNVILNHSAFITEYLVLVGTIIISVTKIINKNHFTIDNGSDNWIVDYFTYFSNLISSIK